MKDYITVSSKSTIEIVVKKSKFITNVIPINNEQEATDFIDKIKSQYWDATHNVYAYVLEENCIQRYSDDGEPKGTAGLPTLQAIKDSGLSNVAVVTTRYFGGTLLGASGLIRAYRESAKDALDQSFKIIKKMLTRVEFSIDYTHLGKVQSEILNLEFLIGNITYADNVIIQVLLEQRNIEQLKNAMMNLLNGNIEINIIGEEIAAIDLK